MTQKQAFNEITSELKWYIGIYSQSYASQIVQRFNAGLLKEKTINDFLSHFGYLKIKEAEYKKAEGKPINLKTK